MIGTRTATVVKRKHAAKPLLKHRSDTSLGWLKACTSSVALAVLVGALLRFLTALYPHSGQGKPPMFGDYEAQRHWMEITVNLPASEWYKNSSNNDLQYWGLDYPPLTAYHSWLTGKVAASINSSYVQLFTSRGLESLEHKTFMRWTVFIADFLVFFPSVLHYFYVLPRETQKLSSRSVWLALILIYPGFIIIDHGHFQYNCISLGFTVAGISFLLTNRLLVSGVFFTLALNYKQMSLYHALPFFIYMLRLCIDQNSYSQKMLLFTKLGVVVSATFAVIWLPFLTQGRSALDVVHRIFPVARGIFEDKVANVWCVVNVVYKLKSLSMDYLIRLCAGATLTFSLPSLISLFKNPSPRHFLLSLINVSLAFFLFSFQVHEKSILLVALPVLLYAAHDPLPSVWFLTISLVSLFHLALKDNHLVPFLALSTLFCVFICNSETILKANNGLLSWLLAISSVGSIVILAGFVLVEPPARYPDLWPLLNAVYAAIHFVLFFLYFNWAQIFGKISQHKE